MVNRITKLVAGAGQGLVGAVGGRLLGFASGILAARILGPVEFGLYSIGWTLLRFFSLVAPLGMEKGVLRFAPRYSGKNEAAHTGLMLQVLAVSLTSGLVFGLLLYMLTPWLANEVYQKPDLVLVFRMFAFAFPGIVMLIVVSAATRTTQQVRYSVLIQEIGQPLLGLLLMGLFYFVGLRLLGVVLSDILSLIIATVVGLLVLVRLFPGISNWQKKPVFMGKALFEFSLPASLAAAFVVYIFWIDRIFVGYFRSSAETGLYQAASQISTLFAVVLAGINLIVIPMFADAHARQDFATLEEVYRIGTKWGIYVCIPALVVLLISPAEVLAFFYGQQYASAATVLRILLIGQLINLITGSVNPLIVMTGNQNFLFGLSGIILVCDIGLSALVIPGFGLVGAAGTTVFSLGSVFIIGILWVKAKLGLWPYDRRLLKGIMAAGLTFAVVVLVNEYVSLAVPVLKLFLEAVAAATVFVASLVIQKLDPEDTTFVKLAWKRLTRRV